MKTDTCVCFGLIWEDSMAVRGGYAKGDARRDAIVDVATEVFGTQGYRAATMLQIAASCGISRTGLLHHFPTKESLLEAVLSRRDETSRVQFPVEIGTEDADRAALQRLISVVRHNAESPAIVNLFSVLSAEAGDPEHPAHHYFVTRYAALRAGLEESLGRLKAGGALVDGTDPQALAVELIALMDGVQVQWVLAPDQIDMALVLQHRINAALARPLVDQAKREHDQGPR
jgi:AcrR family transcriptional regulator